ncbi:ABC transporter ATP-binding protein [Candidatus Soleaferrea massiliensis]|uniref:ABC transporter ATP-binding protein n=1 Tax=Candidatus Soleaferrea massiliensis TaxID=1470354 RepID=UPI0005905369|nr:ABC transporter ATP-binding protein [Candidatus Soleaferrea massiliensis]
MEHLIDIKNVSKIYNPGENEVRALDNVSLQVDEGEYVSIVGQSGSGKSTLMNILGCLDIPSSGRYILNGTGIGSMPDDALSEIRNKTIGFIFQGFNLVSNLSALENVELPLLYRRMGREERQAIALDALHRVGLSERVDHLPSQMSGGQQQRVAIARAIAARPPIILADEPTGNLDSRSGETVMEILRELHAEGKTVILITHDNAIADSVDRTIRILDGRIVEDRTRELAG